MAASHPVDREPTDLPDLNVWLALAWTEHPHHSRALHYWRHQAALQIRFCSVTALGLIRLLSQEKAMGEARHTPAEASGVLQGFLRQPGVRFIVGEPESWDVLHALLQDGSVSAQHSTDAHLAAVAITSEVRLVSFDQGFRRFEALRWLQL